jgi:hypothetical protein
MKTGKELKIDNFKNYNIVFGSVNNKHPKAVYINISAWAEPIDADEENYARTIRDINKKVKQSMYNSFTSDEYSDFMKERTIVDLDIRESGIRFGKRSYMNCEITLFLNSEISVNSEILRPTLDKVLSIVIKSTFDSSKIFKFHKRKR